MGCFIACFGGAKDRKHRRRNKKSLPYNDHPVTQSYHLPLQASPSPRKPIIKEAAITTDVTPPELREKQDQQSVATCRKKVTFDLNVKTYEDVAVHEDLEEQAEDQEVKQEVRKLNISPDSSYRYQNCESSDDEDIIDDDDDGEECEDSVYDHEVGIFEDEEESYDSFFSLPMDKVKQQQQNGEEVESPVPATSATSVVVTTSARDRSQYVHSVLNPVENLSQWKEVKSRALPLKNPNKADKENSRSELGTKLTWLSPEPDYKVNKPQKPVESNSTPEISVDASLSSWLGSPVNTLKEKGRNSYMSNSSVTSREEQPILGALTVEDIRQASVTSSPRRSPGKNPDEMPILGTVGSYWNIRAQESDVKGTPNTTSKYSEDKRVNWHSTPFEVRLERALNKAVSEA